MKQFPIIRPRNYFYEFLVIQNGLVLIGLLFAALGIFSLLQRANNEVADTKITDLK